MIELNVHAAGMRDWNKIVKLDYQVEPLSELLRT
jgi:hypothetical protein